MEPLSLAHQREQLRILTDVIMQVNGRVLPPVKDVAQMFATYPSVNAMQAAYFQVCGHTMTQALHNIALGGPGVHQEATPSVFEWSNVGLDANLCPYMSWNDATIQEVNASPPGDHQGWGSWLAECARNGGPPVGDQMP